ncbi:hypothetical protein Ocin01_12555 [Orchesella cincta]|uniref:F-box domain-containing protein n=1 Tax=Orchesella cincta TaxID=48709 RepID=A0A1D2MMT6_ORCCI|nr:hypothetical protein Ocin01_12555 [Orchesella cincta]
MSEVTLFDLPLVVQGLILSNLSIKQQLKFRLVCRETKSWIDRNGSLIAKNIPSTQITSYRDQTFRNFCFKKPEPTHLITNVHLENESVDVFNDRAMKTFVHLHSHFITSLHLKRYYVCRDNVNQRRFLEALTNMKSLEMDEIWISASGNSKETMSIKIPETFRNLESLKFGRMIVYREGTDEIITTFVGVGITADQKKVLRWHVYDLLDVCTKLIRLRVPTSPKGLFENSFDESFRLLNYVRLRTRGIPDRPPTGRSNLMYIDLHRLYSCTSSLEVLLIIGARMRIQFKNVNSKLFKSGSSFTMVGAPPGTRNDFINSFISTYMVNTRFEYVQKLTIQASLIQNECIVGRNKGPDIFPNLVEINIILDIGFDPSYGPAVYSANPNDPSGARFICFPRADQVLRFFFPERLQYNFCRTLGITFTDPIQSFQKRATPNKLSSLPTIVSCLPEIKNLTISGFNGIRQTFLQLWNGFPNLEKLVVERCTTLNAACFISGDGNPNKVANFHCFKKLQYLELIGLESMPGMTTKRGLGLSVLSRIGLEPFSLLTKDEPSSKTAVWIRPQSSTRRPVLMSESTVVTRSVTRTLAMKRKAANLARSKRRRLN